VGKIAHPTIVAYWGLVVRFDGHTLHWRAILRGFAPHILVLYREIPFILNIKKPGEALAGPGFF
jgi:hypothetical protein